MTKITVIIKMKIIPNKPNSSTDKKYKYNTTAGNATMIDIGIAMRFFTVVICYFSQNF